MSIRILPYEDSFGYEFTGTVTSASLISQLSTTQEEALPLTANGYYKEYWTFGIGNTGSVAHIEPVIPRSRFLHKLFYFVPIIAFSQFPLQALRAMFMKV